MARRKSSSRSTKVTMEDGLAVAAGALASVVANKLINSYIPEGQADMLGKVIPVLKAAGGAYLATTVKDRRLKMAGLGMAATGAIELGQKFAPEFVAIGSAGDIYQRLGGLGTSLTEIPLSISGSNYDSPAMLGVENLEMATL
ncbi:hypothetical protein [Neolewinella agarilytica]|nr:hypothetical protein [Neolewinella agarilytica]